jgi:hypothetical protein
VGAGESEDDGEEEMVEEDEVEEAAFDLKWAQIAFINILPQEGRDKNTYREVHSFLFPLSPQLSEKFLGEICLVPHRSVQHGGDIQEKGKRAA